MPDMRQPSLPEIVYNALLTEILDGRRAPGSKLSEDAICRELGVSRTPAREALLQLHRDGLVDRRPRRGCVVRALDVREIADTFECRCRLECLALDLGFAHIPDADLARLEADLAGARTRRRSLEIDDRLHALILAACPNRTLREIAAQLVRRTHPFRLWRTLGTATIAKISEERRGIIRAIRRRDKKAALRLLAAHIDQGRRRMEDAANHPA